MITKEMVSQKIYDYLNHSIPVEQLVTWAEDAMIEEEVKESDADIISEVIARLGVADVQNFGLLWEDCEQLLSQLGYQIRFNLEKVIS
ncbi:MAG: hypothetical protein H0W62_06110 [Chitinophagales bacterium]|nr:hypothetical protein [Chitinophagales bacterium]